MILYHGSENIIDKPVYRGGKRYNDYGYGFYCTEFSDVAREWAVSVDHDGYLNRYDFSVNGLKLLDLNEYSILTWIAILLQNRTFALTSPMAFEGKEYIIEHFGIPYEKYDVITGYRADDSYFSFAQDFISNTISVGQLRRAMHLGDLGNQIVIKSKKAFERLVFENAEPVSRDIWLRKRMERDERARTAYFSMNRKKREKGELYIADIMDEELGIDDKGL